MNNKLSLVFCCYNVSQYIDGIYNWLNEQPYKDIEVIFIEDFATDDTKQKLYSIAHDSRIKIIENKKNLGLSESRNVGIRNATGDYIGFPDPDDLFDLSWLIEVNKVICTYYPDVIITAMREEYEKNGIIEYTKNIKSRYSGLYLINDVDVILNLEKTMLFGYMNNKFYKREILTESNYLCKTMALKEDFDFNINVFRFAKNFFILNQPYYFYKKRVDGNSLTSKFVTNYFEIHLQCLIQFKKLIEDKSQITEEVENLLFNRFVRYLVSAIERNGDKNSGLSFFEQNAWIKRTLKRPECVQFYKGKNSLTGAKKVLAFMLNKNISLFLLFISKGVGFFKKRYPIMFAKVK